MSYPRSESVSIYRQDLDEEFSQRIRSRKIVAWDIETSGLNWVIDQIGTCQLFTLGEPPAVVQISKNPPRNLISLLLDTSVKKVFHHAMFDLKFMCYKWKVHPQNIACTKIASKLLDPEGRRRHTLKILLEQYLGVAISKRERLSDWMREELSDEQLAYATEDVIYLIRLLSLLEEELKLKQLLPLAHQCFEHIPTRVQLDILGYPDVYRYGA